MTEAARSVVRLLEVDGKLHEYRGLPELGMAARLTVVTLPLELARAWRLARMECDRLHDEIVKLLPLEIRAELKAKALRR